MAGVPIASSVTLGDVIERCLIPVVVIDDAGAASVLGDALVAGGLPVAEVTFRTAAAAEAISVLAGRGDVLVGAGTVLSAEHVDRAVDAGASFIVSPGLAHDVIQRAQEREVVVLPGCATASDLMKARAMGFRTVKFFPAKTLGGVPAIKALASAFVDMQFVPTGGVNAGNARDYLSLQAVPAVGGSWMVPKDLLAASDGDALSRVVAEAIEVVAMEEN